MTVYHCDLIPAYAVGLGHLFEKPLHPQEMAVLALLRISWREGTGDEQAALFVDMSAACWRREVCNYALHY